jgi:uncharacterized protein (TIGR03118 family)
MKARKFALVVPILLGAACEDSNSVEQLRAADINQRFSVTYLAADQVVAAQTAGTGAAGSEAGTTGAAGTGVSATGAAGTGVSATGAAGTGSPPPPSPVYQVISTGDVTIDPNLVNAWGLAFAPTGAIWVASAGTGLGTVYDASGQISSIVVTIPPAAGGAPTSSPTGLVFNATGGFQNDAFIFATENGTIAGWQAGSAAVTRVDNAGSGAVYKGLAIASQNDTPRIFATDFHNAKVDVFDTTYTRRGAPGFVDPALPAGFAPFGIQAIGTSIYVTYARQDAAGEDDVKGEGNGYVDVYDFDGVLLTRLVTQGVLNSPWAVAMAPADLGVFSELLLIGNFGDGRIHAYDPDTGALLGTATDASGRPIEIDGLWALVFGNDSSNAARNQLFFTAGPGGERHGALGRLDFIP